MPGSSNIQTALDHHRRGKRAEAKAIYIEILRADPNRADASHLLGVALLETGERTEALNPLRRAVELHPNVAAYHDVLGTALGSLGKTDEAIAAFNRAISLQPNVAAFYYNLGIALKRARRLEESRISFQKAIDLQPTFAQALNNLGNTYRELRRTDDAIDVLERAAKLNPNLGIVWSNLGVARKDAGEVPLAIECFDRCLVVDPGNAAVASNRLSMLLFDEATDNQRILREHQQWNARFAQPLVQESRPHENDRNPDRRLRVGYVSPDFREHPIGRLITPLLQHHDHQSFEIFCYSSVRAADFHTQRLRKYADVWRDVGELSDAQLAEMIRNDRIDILVDLTMHLAGNRLLLFARKSAPIQVTYLAYCGTTGVSAIDYRFTDPYLDPPGEDRFYTEKSVRLETFWCYEAPAMEIPVSALRAVSAGHITFGCFNNFCKIAPSVFETWAQILRGARDSRLVLHASVGSHRDRVTAFFGEHGIDASRIRFTDMMPFTEYLKLYDQVDIALDPFPHGGGTTTCDAMWKGVPIVSLRGRTSIGRGGASILAHVGLPELLAESREEYVQTAIKLASDLPRLATLRAELRARMSSSPLMNAPKFATTIESKYRQFWRDFVNT